MFTGSRESFLARLKAKMRLLRITWLSRCFLSLSAKDSAKVKPTCLAERFSACLAGMVARWLHVFHRRGSLGGSPFHRFRVPGFRGPRKAARLPSRVVSQHGPGAPGCRPTSSDTAVASFPFSDHADAPRPLRPEEPEEGGWRRILLELPGRGSRWTPPVELPGRGF